MKNNEKILDENIIRSKTFDIVFLERIDSFAIYSAKLSIEWPIFKESLRYIPEINTLSKSKNLFNLSKPAL